MHMTKHARAVQPIAQTLIDNLVMLARTFADIAGIKITTVGTNSTKTASFYVDLEEGKTSCTLRKYDLLTTWFADNWPEGHEMPTLTDPHHYKKEGNKDVVKEVVNRSQAKARKEVLTKNSSSKKESRGGGRAKSGRGSKDGRR
jgi:hypothetical protein